MVAARTGIALFAATVMLASCSAGSQDEPITETVAEASGKQPATDFPDWYRYVTIEQTYMETAAVLYAAGAVVEGEIVDVRGPFWNRTDGTLWTIEEHQDSFADPRLYREVDLQVTEVYRDEIGLGDVVMMSVGGSGLDWDEHNRGEFAEDDVVVVALVESYQLFLEGPDDRIYPLGGPAGVFNLMGDNLASQAPIPMEMSVSKPDLNEILSALRTGEHPEWDHFRYPPTAAERLEDMEAIAAELRAENERLEADPENVCYWIGDEQRAREWLERHPESEWTLEILMDPQYAATVCGIEVPVAETTP